MTDTTRLQSATPVFVTVRYRNAYDTAVVSHDTGRIGPDRRLHSGMGCISLGVSLPVDERLSSTEVGQWDSGTSGRPKGRAARSSTSRVLASHFVSVDSFRLRPAPGARRPRLRIER